MIFFQVKRICVWNRAENSFSKLVFFVMCEIELKPSEGKFFHVWKQKKLFFGRKTFFFFFMSENLFSMNKTDRTFVFPHVKPPTRKKLYFKENIFFFSAKKIFVQQKKLFMCETEIKPFFQQWNQGRVCFGHVKQKNPFFRRKTYYSF